MQYLGCSIRSDYYRHILPLVLTHDTIRYENGITEGPECDAVENEVVIEVDVLPKAYQHNYNIHVVSTF